MDTFLFNASKMIGVGHGSSSSSSSSSSNSLEQRNAFVAGAVSVSVIWWISSSFFGRRSNYKGIDNIDTCTTSTASPVTSAAAGTADNDNDHQTRSNTNVAHNSNEHNNNNDNQINPNYDDDHDNNNNNDYIDGSSTNNSLDNNNNNNNKSNHDNNNKHLKEAIEHRKMLEKALEKALENYHYYYSRDTNHNMTNINKGVAGGGSGGALKIIDKIMNEINKIMNQTNKRIGELPSKIQKGMMMSTRERWPWESLRRPSSKTDHLHDDDEHDDDHNHNGEVDDHEDDIHNDNRNEHDTNEISGSTGRSYNTTSGKPIDNDNHTRMHSQNVDEMGNYNNEHNDSQRSTTTSSTGTSNNHDHHFSTPPTNNNNINIKTSNDTDTNPNSKSTSNNQKEEEKNSDTCIGSIFGLDVGGTLSKLLYFEKKENPSQRRRGATTCTTSDITDTYSSYMSKSNRYKNRNRYCISSGNSHSTDASTMPIMRKQFQKGQNRSTPIIFRSPSSNLNLTSKKSDEPESNSLHSSSNESSNSTKSNQVQINDEPSYMIYDDDTDNTDIVDDRFSDTPPQPLLQTETDETTKQQQQQQTLNRSYSMFDINKASKEEERQHALERFYTFVRQLDAYESDVKDKSRSFYSRTLGGEFHFIQFETRYISHAMDLIKVNKIHLNISQIGATGGGAHKYAEQWNDQLGIKIAKQDELDSLVSGMQFILADVVGECYTFKPKDNIPDPGTEMNMNVDMKPSTGTCSDNNTESEGVSTSTTKVEPTAATASNLNDDEAKSFPQNSKPSSSNQEKKKKHAPKKAKGLDEYWKSRKVKRDFIAKSDSYPYLLVMIGTGVSVLRVDGPRKHERISGSTIGGGTYWGLCRLLTDAEDFESVLNLAERGDPSKVDMMVGDIYGQNSNALDKLGLTADVVASSFGKLVAKQHPARGLTQEDLARALLLMVTNNIGQVAYLNAKLHNTKRIYFVGNFLHQNVLSQKRLAYAINYWSSGKMEALFLEHEGYFGALGAFLLHQGVPQPKSGVIPNPEGVIRNSPMSKKRSDSF